MADRTKQADPAKIENEVRHTQDDIGDTVEKLEEKLSDPEEVSRSVIGDERTDVAKEAIELTRTNPSPVALIAIGLVWLVASTNSRAFGRLADRFTGKRSGSDEGLRPRSAEPAPIGPPPPKGEAFDRRR